MFKSLIYSLLIVCCFSTVNAIQIINKSGSDINILPRYCQTSIFEMGSRFIENNTRLSLTNWIGRELNTLDRIYIRFPRGSRYYSEFYSNWPQIDINSNHLKSNDNIILIEYDHTFDSIRGTPYTLKIINISELLTLDKHAKDLAIDLLPELNRVIEGYVGKDFYISNKEKENTEKQIQQVDNQTT